MTERSNTISFVEIDHADLVIIKAVGKGSFGTVYKGKYGENFVAVKYIEYETSKNAFTLEVRQLSRVNHPNIIGLYGACTKRPHICLVMEFAEGGSLYNFLHCNPKYPYTASHAMSWAKQCAEGVAYLHSMVPKPMIHRDLKPPNLLLVNSGTVIKICDFGTVTDKSTLMTNNRGSAAWMAPEVFEGSTYTEKCDVFSWGIILWEVLTREQPFKEIELTYSIMWSVHKGHRPNLIEGCPKPIEKLMTSCWDPAPASRPSMQDVVDTMTLICEYFPGADVPLSLERIEAEEEEEDFASDQDLEDYTLSNISTTNFFVNSRFPLEAIKEIESKELVVIDTASTTPTNSVVNNLANLNSLNLNATSTSAQRKSFLSPLTPEARWASSDSGNLENPKIVASTFKDEFNGQSSKASQRMAGNLKNVPFLEPLNVDVDPNAWNLSSTPYDTQDFQQQLGNTANNQGTERLTVTKTGGLINSTTGLILNNAVNDQNMNTGMPTIHNNLSANRGYNNDTDNSNNRPNHSDSLDLESLNMMLDPHLRPVNPIRNHATSQQIFQEHKDIAEDYLKIQTEIAYLTKHREELLANMSPEEREMRLEICNKLKEKESLTKLESSLKRQLEMVKSPRTPQEPASSLQSLR